MVEECNGEEFVLNQSTAILRYLSDKFQVADHWYPQDNKVRSHIDSFLDWYHSTLRMNMIGFLYNKYLMQRLFNKTVEPKVIEIS